MTWRDKLIDIQPYTAGEQPTRGDIIKLNSNENPFPPAPGVEAVIKNFPVDTLRKYPQIDGKDLRQAAADYYGLNPESVFTANGSDEVLALAFRGFFNSPKPILFPDITYSFYPVWCKYYGIIYERPPVDEGFRIHPEDYFRENGGIIIANPNAPTGIELTREQIIAIMDHNRDSVVIIDEAYVDFGGKSSIDLISRYDNLLIVQTFSKGRSLAGMRVGLAFGSPELISVLTAVKNSFNSYPLDSLAQAAAIASLADDVYFRKRVKQVITVRENTKAALERLGFLVTDSKANFLFAANEEVNAESLKTWLLGQDILIRHFDLPGINNHVRITIGTEAQMDSLIEKIEEYLLVK
ncbi:histidinol-phosphate aminotransferase [Clostridia bacterium]|nr:histidinol-phosphate aminotransferase [Clostridia bacterium]